MSRISSSFESYFNNDPQRKTGAERLRWWKDSLYVDPYGGVYEKRQTFYHESTCMDERTAGPLIAFVERLCGEWQIQAKGHVGNNRNPRFAIVGWNYWFRAEHMKKKERVRFEKHNPGFLKDSDV